MKKIKRCLIYTFLFSFVYNNLLALTEKDANRLFPTEKWSKLHLQIIFYGREYCPARNFEIINCPITSVVGRRSLFK